MLFVALALVTIGCSGRGDTDLTIGDVPSSVEGNVVSLPIEVDGIDIVKADGDRSDEKGHFHVFIDQEPVDVGELILPGLFSSGGGAVHSADNPINLWGLRPGKHEFAVVLGDGTHERIAAGAQDSVTVDVKGPGVQGLAPPTVRFTELNVSLYAQGIEILPSDDDDGEGAHYHVLVDPDEPPKAGEVIPEPVPNEIIHTADERATITGLEEGEHTIWIVLGDRTHRALDPAVMDKVVVTVEQP